MKIIVNQVEPVELEQLRARVSYRYDKVLNKWRKFITYDLPASDQLVQLLMSQSSLVQDREYDIRDISFAIQSREGMDILTLELVEYV